MAINEVKFLTGYDVKVAVAAPTVIQHSIERYYDRHADYDEVLSALDNDVQVVRDEDEVDLQELERATEEAPVVRLVNALLSDAIRKRASDVHVEPYEKMLRVRFRIDGVLYEIMQPPLRLKNAITSRIKVMAKLDIAERRLPQDGRLRVRVGARDIDVRVSVVPTVTSGLAPSVLPRLSRPAPLTYRAKLALIAVLPVPNRSYATPTRGLRSFQFGTFLIAGNDCGGTNAPAGTDDAATDSRSQSYRSPALTVTRFNRH